MIVFLVSRASLLAVVHTSRLLVASQDVPQSSPPFPVPANSSSIVPFGTVTGVSSSSSSITTLMDMNMTQTSTTRSTESSSASRNSIVPPDTSVGSPSSIETIPTPTESAMTSESSSSLGAPITSGNMSSADPTSSNTDTANIIVSSSSIDLITLPPGTISAPSSSDGILLPPGITLPPNPTTTLLPTGTDIQSSASEMSLVVAGIFPLLQRWIDSPQPPQVTDLTNELDNILPAVSGFLGKLPIPTDGVEPCKSGNRRRNEGGSQGLEKRGFLDGLFKTAFSLVTCIIDTTNNVKDGVIKGTIDAVKALENDLKPMVNALNEIEPNQPTPSASTTGQPSSTQLESSSACTLNIVSNCNVACTATATTTVGGQKRRAEGDACTTICDAPITQCDATGVTSASTTTSTLTAVQRCAKNCPGCHAPKPPPEPLVGGDYLTETNGLAYAPASTISILPTYVDIAARNIADRETGKVSPNLHKRAFTNPKDSQWNGNVGDWLLDMMGQPGSKNLGLGNDPQWFSTSITDQLLNDRESWNLGTLHGCTAIIVVSRKRIFMAHIWEDPTIINKDNNFQRDALDVFGHPGGDGKGVTQGLSTFTGPGGDFESIADNHVRAMVVTPYNRSLSDPQPDELEFQLEFPDQVDQIKEMLNRILRLPIPAMHIPYEDRGEDPLWRSPHGKVLIQYDPVQAVLEQATGQNCQTQVASLEVWFEEVIPNRRYGDIWPALPSQTVAAQPGPSRRFIRGRQVIDANEEEWQEYAKVLRRQNGVCARPSGTPHSSSTPQDLTTLQTTFISPSGGGDNTDLPSTAIEPAPNTTVAQSSTTKNEHHTSTGVSESPPTASLRPKSKALSIVLKAFSSEDNEYNSWIFFETNVGVQADVCGSPILDDEKTRWSDDGAINNPPWPHGTFTMKLYDENNCEYLNNGEGAGILHCPSFGDGNNVSCREDSEKSQVSAIKQCIFSGTLFIATHRAAYCEW